MNIGGSLLGISNNYASGPYNEMRPDNTGHSLLFNYKHIWCHSTVNYAVTFYIIWIKTE
jgi:hypothetical protein